MKREGLFSVEIQYFDYLNSRWTLASARLVDSRSFMAENSLSISSKAPHSASAKIEQKANVYEAEYLGSGTFKIVKPMRKDAKRRQSSLKGTTRGARK